MVPAALQRLKHVEVLSLRQNLISDASPLATLTTLRDLDLYDNELTSMAAFSALTNLE